MATAVPQPLPVDDSGPSGPVEELRSQFTQPGDVMSVLLLLGGDVIQRALAQLSGGLITPVAFSFGWVTYAITALLTAVGENKLLPLADTPGYVVNSKSRYCRENRSWVVSRLIRDYHFWRDPRIAEAEKDFLEQVRASQLEKPEGQRKTPRISLSIAFYQAHRQKIAGKVEHDWLYHTGIVCIVVQLGIASIPWGLWGDWSIFLTTMCGVLFALGSGALPQWKAEKWCCRSNTTKTVTLTRGNGSGHAFVIVGNGLGLDLEDLAGGREVDRHETRVCAAVMAALWLGLLIAVSGLRQNPWFLLAVGVIGMIQNVVVCAAPRKPSAFGVHLEFMEAIVDQKVMNALMTAEEKHPGVGRSLVDVFFPGSILRPHEEEYWKNAERNAQG